ncbi:Sulfotransferase [Heracleum sosnowskyi]|uniref:Sulfotransferase n=1 Tax=Heracleum sosnowskyi TaxID=360622 RepID=A0AAD8M6K0_9APIA|nr:Sulfotransferase [Heracleum sosnowskyi]
MKLLNDSENIDCEYKARISLLPERSIAFKVANDFTRSYEYQGFWFRIEPLRGLMWAQDHFIPQPASTLIASYPKTGTTWLKALSFSIATRNRYDIPSSPLQTASPHECMPFLEYDIPKSQSHKYYPEIPLFSTHVPYTTMPESITASDCKIVYICKDPTDTFVSWWHFVHKLALKDTEFVPIEEGFQQFSDGKAKVGDWKNHLPAKMKEQMDQIMELKLTDSGLTCIH